MVIPGQVTSIEAYAFSYNALSNISIPSNVSLIGERAFSANQLTNIVIPDSVTTIGDFAFHGNPLETVSISSDAVFDLSVFPDGVEIIIREEGVEPTPEPSPKPTPSEKNIVDQIESIYGITIQDEVSTFELTNPISVGNQDLETLIFGTDSKDRITGSSEGEVLSGGGGKDVLKGGGGPDGFLFQNPDGFGKKEVDNIKDINLNEGDSILVDKDVFGLGRKIKLKVVKGKKSSKKASKSKKDFVYDEKKGLLYFNKNNKEKGWGDGGLFANLKGAPELGADDFTIVSD